MLPGLDVTDGVWPVQMKMVSKIAGLCLLTSVLANAPLLVAASPKVMTSYDDGARLYRDSLSADANCRYAARLSNTYWKTGRSFSARIVHDGSGIRSIEYLAPQAFRGRWIFETGANEWLIDTKRHIIERRPVSQPNPHQLVIVPPLLKKNYVITVDKRPTEAAERPAVLLVIRRREDGKIVRRLWVDKCTDIVLKKEIYGDRGSLLISSAISDVSFHPEFVNKVVLNLFLNNRKFQHTIQRDTKQKAVHVLDLREALGGNADSPKVIQSFRLTGANMIGIGAQGVLHLRYTDGLNVISVFEKRKYSISEPTRVPESMRPIKVANIDAHIIRKASLITLNWDVRLLNITVIGEVPFSSLKRFVSAMH